MSVSAQRTSEQLKEIIEENTNTGRSTWEVQDQVEDGEEVLDPENSSSVLNMFLNTINSKFEHECLDEEVRLLNACPIHQSPGDRVPAHKYSIQKPARN
jgi:PIN domain nuclease of toxin-antitoxin system